MIFRQIQSKICKLSNSTELEDGSFFMGKNDRIMAKSYFDVLGEINFDSKEEEIDITGTVIGIDKML